MSTTTAVSRRAAIESRRVREELNTPAQSSVRFRTVREMEYGRHWLWRNGAEYYTAEGMRFLAEAHDRESDPAAALVCRRLADEVDAMEARDAAAAAHKPTQPDYFAELERRHLA
jgi:hypothetical protein